MITSIISSLTESVNLTFTTFILVFTVCILVQRLLSSGSRSRYQNLPPCPAFKLPVLGHLHLLDLDLTRSFRRFREQLGDVFRLQFGNRVCVVICGFNAIKEALVKNGDTFTYRPVLPLLDRIVRGAGKHKLLHSAFGSLRDKRMRGHRFSLRLGQFISEN